jgi:hypothetical protein
LILVLLICSGAVLVWLHTRTSLDPLSGLWVGDWGPTPSHRNPITVSLRLNGTMLSGSVNPGPHALEFTKASFDVHRRNVHLEIATVSAGREIHYVIDGRVERSTLIGTWYNEDNKGNFRLMRK